MLQRKVKLAFGLAILGCSLAASAQMSYPNGWYIEGNYGTTHSSNKSYGTGATTHKKSGTAGSLNFGYKFNPYVGVEAGYTKYSDVPVKDSTSVKVAHDKRYSYDLALKGILPLSTSGAELFAKVGAGRVNSKQKISNEAAASVVGVTATSHTKTGLFLGAGIQYYFTPEFAMVGQWARAKGNSQTGTIDAYTVGFSFLFS